MAAFSFERRVEFCETDAAGIAHFSSLAIYMEQAEHALIRSVGISVYPQRLLLPATKTLAPGIDPSSLSGRIHETGGRDCDLATAADAESELLDVTWPRVHVSLDFLGPARFEDVLMIEVEVARMGESSVTFEHVIHGPQRSVARGSSTSVCCKIDRDNAHGLTKRTIPPLIRDKLSTYLRS